MSSFLRRRSIPSDRLCSMVDAAVVLILSSIDRHLEAMRNCIGPVFLFCVGLRREEFSIIGEGVEGVALETEVHGGGGKCVGGIYDRGIVAYVRQGRQ